MNLVLVQVMASRLFGAKALSELANFRMDTQEQISTKRDSAKWLPFCLEDNKLT